LWLITTVAEPRHPLVRARGDARRIHLPRRRARPRAKPARAETVPKGVDEERLFALRPTNRQVVRSSLRARARVTCSSTYTTPSATRRRHESPSRTDDTQHRLHGERTDATQHRQIAAKRVRARACSSTYTTPSATRRRHESPSRTDDTQHRLHGERTD